MGNLEDILKTHVEELVDIGRDLSIRSGDNPIITPHLKPRISYDLLMYKEHSEFCFTNSDFDKDDFHLYFEKMIEISNTSLGDLMNGETDLDFEVYSSPNSYLRNMFFSKTKTQRVPENIPSFGRIGLYNSKNNGDKAPRIFFAVGHYATLHILACDPYHNIYKGK